jgi:predicted component of type VI protein secretion system
MSLRIPPALTALGLLLVLASPAAAQKAKVAKAAEPSYDGRPLSSWTEELSAPSPYTRHSAAYAIASMGPKAAPAVPALIKGLEDSESTVRYACAIALREIGPDAKEAVEPLKKLLDDRSEDVVSMARKAIKAISGEVVE